jgi:hypothetical protein
MIEVFNEYGVFVAHDFFSSELDSIRDIVTSRLDHFAKDDLSKSYVFLVKFSEIICEIAKEVELESNDEFCRVTSEIMHNSDDRFKMAGYLISELNLIVAEFCLVQQTKKRIENRENKNAYEKDSMAKD